MGQKDSSMTLRKAGGYLLLVLFMAAYSVAAVMLGEAIVGESVVWLLLYYGIAGVAIVYPCIKILDWSHGADRRR